MSLMRIERNGAVLLRSFELLVLLLLIGSFINLSGCKTPPTPPVQPQVTQKPPPPPESDPLKEDVSEQDQKASRSDSDPPEKQSVSDSKTPGKAAAAGPAEQDHVTPSTRVPETAPKEALSFPAPQEAQTSEEMTSDMDRQLQESLSTFDGQLLKQRKLLESLQDVDTGEAFSDGAAGEIGEVDAVAGGSTTEETKPTASANEDPPQAAAGTPGEPERGGTRPAAIPPDIPDGRDDDIVARQIREAAMREKDPKLREKLWEEYRRYKQSSGAYTPWGSGIQYARYIAITVQWS